VRFRYLVPIILVIIGILAYYCFIPGEEKRIKKQFTLLAEAASKKGEESPLAMAQKMNQIRLLFSEKVNLVVPYYNLAGDFSRQDVVNFATRARMSFLTISLRFYDLKIDLSERDTAKVDLTGRLKGFSSTREETDEVRELFCVLKKIDNRWLFSKIEVVEVLKK
jgi:hypothetical protein